MSFQLFTRLAAVFAEKINIIGTLMLNCQIQWSLTLVVLIVHIRTFGNQEVNNFFTTSPSSLMQWSSTVLITILRIQICSFG